MPKTGLMFTVIIAVAIVIVGEAVYAFTRPQKLTLAQGGILIGIAVAALIVLMVSLWFIWRGLTKK
jgi:Co/Zn/Cd efflux system component